ncbi:QcrA and Rieske domain-containing protein [Streptomyces bambusae]|uniref:Cytochrome bc1 complex Rieske iron-sulfur subunit n=1 Tax=Streptomyces bambusae TaxID=1550616 RepID=A0ABS6ZCP9_9ACTN|nr:Rieske (2Fe-2S) protein [Streptomyces bambusae]MBW5485533.1 Rieske 2Fe-2S domain-containing protein [Streptomyces bambusae]
MSVTEQAPPGAGGDPESEAGTDAAHARLRDRISADSLTSRRDYLRIVATVSGGLAAGGIGVAAGILHRHGDSEQLPEMRKVADQLLPGESVAFRFPGDDDRAVAVRLSDGTLVGYSAVCTHLACAVLWRADRGPDGELYCPCHEGVFDARTGKVAAGPPPRPLPRIFLTEQLDGSVWAVATARSGEPAEDALCRQFRDARPDMAQRLGCPGAAGAETTSPDRRRT